MNYLKQFLWIICFSFLGEILHELIPLPVPASIYGLALLFLALLTGMLKLEQVKGVADFLIDIMAVLFIPAGVGVMTNWDVLEPVLVPVVFIMLFTTIVVMIAAGRVTQAVIRFRKKDSDRRSETKGR